MLLSSSRPHHLLLVGNTPSVKFLREHITLAVMFLSFPIPAAKFSYAQYYR